MWQSVCLGGGINAIDSPTVSGAPRVGRRILLGALVSGFLFWRGMLVAGLACLVHAVLPCLFKTTGRSAISELHTKMLVKRATHREWAILRAVRSDLNVALLSFRRYQPVGVTWAL